MKYVTLEEAIYIYTETVNRLGGQAGIRDEKVLEEVLAKPLVVFEGEEMYPDLWTKVSVFIYAMINNRPYTYGNKPAALVTALYLLRINGYQITGTQESLISLISGIEEGNCSVDSLINWFRKNSVLV